MTVTADRLMTVTVDRLMTAVTGGQLMATGTVDRPIESPAMAMGDAATHTVTYSIKRVRLAMVCPESLTSPTTAWRPMSHSVFFDPIERRTHGG